MTLTAAIVISIIVLLIGGLILANITPIEGEW